ncbi:C4-dicarboxylate TRAP transporter substrate-binding protein [Blastococcus sp. BMG 814]|uniref:C4-dicarboxylate TRAP transporter substrate-binding protein n=1 Tax=Blastococcus carthaginiensis TaxID=3050034 RepID=A0ABT9IAT1_9ACTN|nr:C4-dicarboxylate TRAP transporter substrate-binding protein [Blastococcus carthaginiensis]MDP5182674.1 C4-dicarboxylate TRAP transporter substrate-binding protein [Blastococcus carthaginiensis]
MHSSQRTKRAAAVGAAAVLAASLAACGGDSGGGGGGGGGAQSYDWQYANYLPPNSSLSTGIANYFDSIEEGGDITVEEFYQEALLSATDTLPGVAQGRADLGFMIALYYPGELPLSQIVGVPFQTDDAEAQVRAMNDLYENNEAFRAEYEDQGVHVLSFVPLAPTMIATAEPLSGLDDLAGRQIRAVGLLSQAIEQTGASPVALSAPEVYESVERGVIDGFTSYPFDVAVANSLNEVAPHMTDPGTGLYNLGALVITKSLWDGLPEETRELMTEEIDQYVTDAIALLAEEEENTCDTFLEAGGTPGVFPEADVEEFESIVGDSVLEAWRETTVSAGASEDVVDGFLADYQAALEEYAAESTYVPGLVACAERNGS